MVAPHRIPGERWLQRLHDRILRTGVLTGVYLGCILFSWVWIANRIPRLEAWAGMRNQFFFGALLVLMSIPVLRFRAEPGKLFVSGVIAWTLLTFTYAAMLMRFSLLESRMGVFHFFLVGTVFYSFIASFEWVLLMFLTARQMHNSQPR